MKPDKTLIDTYEYFVLGNSENLKMTRMLKVAISRYILIGEILLFRFVLTKILILPIILKKPGPYIRSISVWKSQCGSHSPVHKLWGIWALIRLHESFGKYVGLDFLPDAGFFQNRG